MSTVVKDLGAVSAYAYAVEKGYTGTEAEFAELMASYADVGQTAVDAKDAAVAAKTAAQTAATTATNKASEATTAATTATNKAAEAQADADAAALDASQALSAASTATTKATEATAAAGTATTAKNDAVSAKTAAETAQGKAEDAQAAAEAVAESIPSDYSQLSEDVTELKSGFTQMDSDVKAEEVRAKSEEARIEALFTAPTQEAVDNWLNAHPEATTTVEDGAITWAKLNSSVQEEIDGKAPAIVQSQTDYTFSQSDFAGKSKCEIVIPRTKNTDEYIFDSKEYLPPTNPETHSTGLYEKTIGNQLIVNGSVDNSANYYARYGSASSSTRITPLYPIKAEDVVYLSVMFDGDITPLQAGVEPIQLSLELKQEDGTRIAQKAGNVNINDKISSVSITASEDIPKMAVILTFRKNYVFDCNVYFCVTVNSHRTKYSLTDDLRLTETDVSSNGITMIPIRGTLFYVADTKDYVDSHIPSNVVTTEALAEYVPNEKNLVYVTPEMFGAVGNGTTDDSAALQRALDACIESNVPMMGFGSYRADTTLILSANKAYVYIHNLDYRGNGEAAFVLRGRYNHLVMDRLHAYYATGSAGLRLETTESTHADYNQIEIQSIYADMNAVEFYNLYGKSHGSQLYYNIFKCSAIHSTKANCFYFNGYQHFAENSFWGKHVSNNNGYFLYCESGTSANNNTNRFYEFCIESSSKNGVYGVASLINCRTTECMDRKKLSAMDEGNIFVFDGVLPVGRTEGCNVDFIAIDVSNAKTLEDCVAKAKELYENGSSPAIAFDSAFNQKKYIVAHGTRLMTFMSTEYTKLSDYVLSGTTFAYFNHKGWIPDNDWYYEVVDSVYYTYETDRCIPTIFDIKTSTEIHLDDSYCAIGIKQFKVVQTDNEKATIYDHNGVLIFDGGHLDAGTYKLYCELLDPDPITIETSKGTITRSSKAMRGEYHGNNEKWSVEKLNIIL